MKLLKTPEPGKRMLTVGAIGLFGIAGLSACGGEADADDAADTIDTSASTATTEESEGEAAAEGGDGTAPDSPLAAGSAVEVGDWSVTVAEATLDATDAIMAENEFNEAPADGFQQAMLTLDGTYNGSETGSLWLDITVGIWADGAFYDSVDCLNVVPGDMTEAPDVSSGGTAGGSTCVEIPTGAESYVVYFEDFMSFDGTRYFVEIA